MWISKRSYDEIQQMVRRRTLQIGIEQGKSAVLAENNKVLQVQLDFMRVRLNQSEKERAQWMEKATGVRVPVPEVLPAKQVADLYGELPDFEDMGDKKAYDLGIQHPLEDFPSFQMTTVG